MNNKYIITSHDGLFNITQPSNLLPLPNLPTISGLTIIDDSLELKCDQIVLIDGIGPEIDGYTSYCCDYCKIDCEEEYYYCYDCRLDMCTICFNDPERILPEKVHELNDEMMFAIEMNKKNKYKKKPIICKSHNLQKRKPIHSFVKCDKCRNIILSEKLYHVQIQPQPQIKTQNQNQNQNCDVYDLCMTCAGTKDGQNIIIEKSLSLINNHVICTTDCTNFGSVCDWRQIYLDEEGNMILFNLNANSKFCGYYGLASVDDGDKIGCYSLNWSINQIAKKLEEYYENDSNVFPIKQLMMELNMQINYDNN